MASVTSGHSYSIIYNTDSNVDDNSTFRFSCIAVSSESRYTSVVPKNCREHQTPYSYAMAHDGSNIGSKLTMQATTTCGSTSGTYSYCVFPSQFMNSVWHDSTKGDITFTNTTMSGWEFSTYGHTVTNWKCWDSTLFETQGYLVLKLSDTISAQTPKSAYMCMKMTKLSNNSYYYYLVQAQNPLVGEERILTSDNDTLTDISTLCNMQHIEPKEQFHVLVKQGFQVASKQDCPNAVRGNFDYTYRGSDNITRCQSTNDRWTVCQDNQTMTFDYSTCSQKMAYSNGGVVWCVASIVGSYTYVMVYNNDTSVDNVNTFRFTCFAVTNNGTFASMAPRNCTENQSPTAFATSQNGSNIGATLTMSAYASCREDNTCSLPSNLQNSIWHDSTKGDLAFTNSSMQGWSMSVFGHTVQNWECLNSSLFASQGYIILRLSDTISGNVPHYGYMCMRLTKVSDYSYYYYLVRGPSDLVGKERIFITTNGSVTDLNSLCVLANIERAEQFHALIKSGSLRYGERLFYVCILLLLNV
ncbi:hypothetical protein CHS0354_025218 [Potamilus streckersoni]|uniref:DUF7042 domain-containing protein n=1 Tax=Potamilus streckersoni TaxID=2493646 RepID=A0AAE0RN52_9BIVA|nr:hypothetical protein CHS0354_025218 [Potamilus streckersoni]